MLELFTMHASLGVVIGIIGGVIWEVYQWTQGRR